MKYWIKVKGMGMVKDENINSNKEYLMSENVQGLGVFIIIHTKCTALSSDAIFSLLWRGLKVTRTRFLYTGVII